MSVLPKSSPWGAVQHCEVMRKGVFMITADDHGGIMVRRSEAGFLSDYARKIALKDGNYLCFEQDCDEQLVIREMIDKNLYQIPDRIHDKTIAVENMNRSVQGFHPEYWETRQKSLSSQSVHTARKEVDTMIDARKDIVFRDENYKPKFKIKDGDSIKITVAYDGEELVRKCRFLDETHMNVGNQCFHMDEFMEKMARVGNQYEPIPDQAPKLDIVIAEPGKPPRDVEIPMNLASLRDILGGELEIVNKDKFSATVQGKNGNGTIAVCGIKDDNLTSLHPYTAQSQKRELAARITDSEEKKPTLAEKLEAGKAKAAAHNTARETVDTQNKKKGEAEH